MLDESQLDEFLNEFFGEEEPASDVTRLKNSGKPNPFRRNEVPSEELEEYTLPTDGMIIRQMERQGKVSRRTWFAFAVMLIVVPILLFFSVKIWGGRKYLLCSLIVVVAAMLPFFMMFEGRKPKARVSAVEKYVLQKSLRHGSACAISSTENSSWKLIRPILATASRLVSARADTHMVMNTVAA